MCERRREEDLVQVLGVEVLVTNFAVFEGGRNDDLPVVAILYWFVSH